MLLVEAKAFVLIKVIEIQKNKNNNYKIKFFWKNSIEKNVEIVTNLLRPRLYNDKINQMKIDIRWNTHSAVYQVYVSNISGKKIKEKT